MQVARAYAALATGELPDLRLVREIGGVETEQGSRPLGISAESLQRVRVALLDVANAGGTAHTALNEDEVGFVMSAKTGSADISAIAVEGADGKRRVRKHTWLAGWFPPKDPVAVLVVFVDDTMVTSSHSSVWIARQFLRRPELVNFLKAEEERR